MRQPRVRSMSDHELVSEAIRATVLWLLEAPAGEEPSRRLLDLLNELRRREHNHGRMICTCSECCRHFDDPFDE